MASRSSKLDFRSEFRSEPRECHMARRPSKFDFWCSFQSEPRQRNMASRASKFVFWVFQSDSGQCHKWPSGLQSLTFVKFSVEKLNVVWPEGLQSLSFLNMEFAEENLPASEDSDDSDSSVFPADARVVPEFLLRAGWPRTLRKLVFDDLALGC